ncbi:MAG: hypothetical protein MJ239_03070 [Bacilli bacterium]|nr:hypothetical protein [Bacilli bacterium]
MLKRKAILLLSSSMLLLVACGDDPAKPTKLAIEKQPQSVTIDFGDSISMSVKVNNPDLVRSYQWYVGLYEEGQLTDSAPLKGTKAKTDTYNLPTYLEYYPDAHYGFRCEITGVDGNKIESDWAQVIVKSEKDVPHIVLGDYLIEPGKTFDLANTPYGSGTITVNESWNHFVFDNVAMTNQFFDSNFEGIGFRYLNYGENCDDITFEFKGLNNFENHYWDDERVDGGAIIQIQALGLAEDADMPSLTLTGSGSVTFYGGSYGIVSHHFNLVQDIDVSLYGQPDRYQNGFRCEDYTLAENRSLRASLTGRVIDSYGDIFLEQGSKFYADLGTAFCGQMGYTSGLNASGDIVVSGAEVKINTLLNFEREVENEIFVITSAIEADYGTVTFDESNVEISTLQYNDAFDIPEAAFSATAVNGITSNDLEMRNSDLRVTIDGTYIAEARAINSHGFRAAESSVYLDVAGLTAGGIECYTVVPEENAPVRFEDTDVYINLYNYLFDVSDDVELLPYDNTGIFGTSFEFESSSENQIVISTNGGATICLRTGVAEEPVTPHEGYTGNYLAFENVTYVSTAPFVYNEESYTNSFGYNFVYETLYEDLGSSNYEFINNLVLIYEAK